MVSTLEQMQVPSGTGPGVRRSKRPLKGMLILLDIRSQIKWEFANFVFKERGGCQNFSTSFWMRFSQAPLCRYRFKFIFDDIIFLLSGNIIEYICF